MCYTGGPRCSSHAKIALKRAMASGNQSRIIKAIDEYRHTPRGIAETRRHDPVFADQLQAERNKMLADRGGITDADVERSRMHLKDPEDIRITRNTDNKGMDNLQSWEKTNEHLMGRVIGRQEITQPAGRRWKSTWRGDQLFSHKTVKAPNGQIMDHVVLTNPQKLPPSSPDHNALALGSLTVSGKKVQPGMHDQFLIHYALVEMKNQQTGQMERGLYVEAISVPKAEQGKGMARWLLSQAESAFPGLRVPATSEMTKDGVLLWNTLSAHDHRYAGVLHRPRFEPEKEPCANYEEARDFVD